MIVACVRTGTKYPVEYVERLKAGVARHLPFRFVCLTDRPKDLRGVETVNIKDHGLPGWWGKMALFEPKWRAGERVIYFDLDTVVTGPLAPLAALDVEFGICANFTRRAGNIRWPCGYGSCVMTIGPGQMGHVWDGFEDDAGRWIARAGTYGDQWVIEQLQPAATFLQDVLPDGFFLHYRDLRHVQPPGCSLAIFAGRSKPHTCEEQWIRRAWMS